MDRNRLNEYLQRGNEPPVTDAELDVFQQRHQIILPLDFRNYLKKIKGSTFVSNLVSLHKLSELEIKKETDGTAWCVFADYSIWIYGLAIRLTDQQSTAVYIMHPPAGHRITDFIDEFLDLLLDPEDNETETFWAGAMILTEEQIRSYKLHRANKNGRNEKDKP